jgi:hypothetical protein
VSSENDADVIKNSQRGRTLKLTRRNSTVPLRFFAVCSETFSSSVTFGECAGGEKGKTLIGEKHGKSFRAGKSHDAHQFNLQLGEINFWPWRWDLE